MKIIKADTGETMPTRLVYIVEYYPGPKATKLKAPQDISYPYSILDIEPTGQMDLETNCEIFKVRAKSDRNGEEANFEIPIGQPMGGPVLFYKVRREWNK